MMMMVVAKEGSLAPSTVGRLLTCLSASLRREDREASDGRASTVSKTVMFEPRERAGLKPSSPKFGIFALLRWEGLLDMRGALLFSIAFLIPSHLTPKRRPLRPLPRPFLSLLFPSSMTSVRDLEDLGEAEKGHDRSRVFLSTSKEEATDESGGAAAPPAAGIVDEEDPDAIYRRFSGS